MGSTTPVVLFRDFVESGQVKPEQFELSEVATPSADPLQEGDVLVTLEYLSVDPYMRGRMRNVQGYIKGPFQPGQPLEGFGIARVLASKAAHLPTSSYIVSDCLKWQKVQTLGKEAAEKLKPIDTSLDVPLTAYLGPLGAVGATAYCSLVSIGKPKPGETAYVSAASGAVGSIVGQLLKNVYGCKVVGSTGSEEKLEYLKRIGYDEAFSYKASPVSEALSDLCPTGIDIFFDNVGGSTLDAALAHMNKHGRILACGAVSQYDQSPEERYGVKNTLNIVFNRLLVQGFIVFDMMKDKELAAAFHRDMPTYLKEGKVTIEEATYHGLENAGKAFCSMMSGANTGKTIVKI